MLTLRRRPHSTFRHGLLDHFSQGLDVETRELGVAPVTDRQVPAQTLGSRFDGFEDLTRFFPHAPRPLFLAMVPGGRVLRADGAVTDRKMDLIAESLPDVKYLVHAHAKAPEIRSVQHCDSAASLLGLWTDNYYHWIVDVLPKIHLLELAGLNDVPLLVPGPLKPFQQETLDLLGIGRDRLVEVWADAVRVDQLYWVNAWSALNFPTSEVRDWLRRRIPPTNSGGPEKVMLLRRGSRSLGPESGLRSLCAEKGIECIEPSALSVQEQRDYFCGARLVIGSHGAALTNCFWTESPTVVELFSPGWWTPPFYTMSCAEDWTYWYQLCRRDSERGTAKNSTLTVDLDQFEAVLDRVT